MVLQSWKIFGFTRDYKNVDGRFDPRAARPKRDKLIRKKKSFSFPERIVRARFSQVDETDDIR